jgi:hypothetical protein
VCGRTDAGSRISQAVSRRVRCGFGGNAGHAGALDILAAGQAFIACVGGATGAPRRSLRGFGPGAGKQGPTGGSQASKL